jgi:hypothetical protein
MLIQYKQPTLEYLHYLFYILYINLQQPKFYVPNKAYTYSGLYINDTSVTPTTQLPVTSVIEEYTDVVVIKFP